jgi:hypothetical protein
VANRNDSRKLALAMGLGLLAPIVGFATESVAVAFIVGALVIAVLTAVFLELTPRHSPGGYRKRDRGDVVVTAAHEGSVATPAAKTDEQSATRAARSRRAAGRARP